MHGTVGPARTTIRAVAARAGVERLTVYRHFPDEAALFEACSTHWSALNPPPDLASWVRIADPSERLRLALAELYDYFARTSGMWECVYRDAPLVPALDRPMAEWAQYLAHARNVLTAGWNVRGKRRVLLGVGIGHALSFSTWRSLTAAGATSETAVAIMTGMLRAVVAAEPSRRYSPDVGENASTRRVRISPGARPSTAPNR